MFDGIFILGFIAIFVYTLTKNVRASARYHTDAVHLSQLPLRQTVTFEARQQTMELIEGVETWQDFDLRSLYPKLPESRIRGHRFLGPLRFPTNIGNRADSGAQADGDFQADPSDAHVFDWHFVVQLRQGYRSPWFQTVVWFELENTSIPNFNLRPRDLPVSVSIPGYSRVEVSGVHSRYQLDSPSTSRAKRLFGNVSLLQDLNSMLLTDNWHIDRYDNTLSVSAFNRLCPPNEIPALVSQAEAMVAGLQTAASEMDAALDARIEHFANRMDASSERPF